MSQDITEHKVKKSTEVINENKKRKQEAKRTNSPSPRSKKVPLQLYSKLTKRKVGLILAAVQSAIIRLVKKESGFTEAEIQQALLHSDVKKVVAKHMVNDNIMLVDRENNPLYRN